MLASSFERIKTDGFGPMMVNLENSSTGAATLRVEQRVQFLETEAE
jgi:hypothetical protein